MQDIYIYIYKYSFVNIVDPDQLVSENPANQDPQCFQHMY